VDETVRRGRGQSIARVVGLAAIDVLSCANNTTAAATATGRQAKKCGEKEIY
jgi:hypothetical protein